MAHRFYTQKLIEAVVRNALAAARASQQGKPTIRLGDGSAAQELRLKEGGYCARFVRQVYETACGLEPFTWEYAAHNARQMCERLARDGHEVTDGSLVPGDIIGMNRNAGPAGHVAIYVGSPDGQPLVAENTSSSTRGEPRHPGTKLTPYSAIAKRVTGVYRLLDEPPNPRWPDFRAFIQVGDGWREIELAPGGDHRRDQGKTYWRVKPAKPR